jgi:hypothetical protein
VRKDAAMTARAALVTGASSGIGDATARRHRQGRSASPAEDALRRRRRSPQHPAGAGLLTDRGFDRVMRLAYRAMS